MKKLQHQITVIAEFENKIKSNTVISYLLDYISVCCCKDRNTSVITSIQKYPAGYRVKIEINYIDNFIFKHNYTKKLSKLSDWLIADDDFCLSSYKYEISI